MPQLTAPSIPDRGASGARDSPLYRLTQTHRETFKQVYDERFAERYGAWRTVLESTLFAFLDCGSSVVIIVVGVCIMRRMIPRIISEPPAK